MPVITRAALTKQIAAGDTRPLYALVGEGDSEKSAVATGFLGMGGEGVRALRVDPLFGGGNKADHLFHVAPPPPVRGPLRGGLERVALYAMGQSKITADDVRQVVAATAEATNFGIANAIEQNDAAEALRELALALDAGAQPFFLMGQLRWVAAKMPRARL